MRGAVEFQDGEVVLQIQLRALGDFEGDRKDRSGLRQNIRTGLLAGNSGFGDLLRFSAVLCNGDEAG